MKIRNTEDVAQYPETYDFLSEEQQSIIVRYMNAVQQQAERYYDLHLQYEVETYKHNLYWRLYNQTRSELTGAKSAYATTGVRVEYNWPGHYHEWILATRADAQAYLDAPDDPYPPYNNDQGLINPLLLSYDEIF